MEMPLHRVVMAWPESLALLRERGMRPGEVGGRALGRIAGGAELADALVQRTRWRAP